MKNQNEPQLHLFQKTSSQMKLTSDVKNENLNPAYQGITSDDPLSSLFLPTRVENALRIHGRIKTVGQFMNMTDHELLKIRNIGVNILSDLKSLRVKLKNTGFDRANSFKLTSVNSKNNTDRKTKSPVISDSTFNNLEFISLFLDKCGSIRDKNVIIRRYGLEGGDSETLEEIGGSYGLTRERIRQIQKRALMKMKRFSLGIRNTLRESLEENFYNSGGFITDEEADLQIPKVINSKNEDGSGSLEMFCDMNLIQSTKLGDIKLFSPVFGGIKLENIFEKLRQLIKNENVGISLSDLKKRMRILNKISDKRFDGNYFILKYCWTDPRIEEVKDRFAYSYNDIYFRHYTSGKFSSKGWVARMVKVLEMEQVPLHFTEITNKLNDLIKEPDRRIDVRRAHSILIESKSFAHVGIRGTYGLTEWGLRKDSVLELIEECLSKAGFPIHWKQILQYVGKYKETKQNNILSLLDNNPKFVRVKSGIYGLRNNLEK